MSILRPSRSGKIGVAVAALAMLASLAVVSAMIIRWCPGGEGCKETSQLLFGLGLVVGLAVSAALGFVARDIADRFAPQPPR